MLPVRNEFKANLRRLEKTVEVAIRKQIEDADCQSGDDSSETMLCQFWTWLKKLSKFKK